MILLYLSILFLFGATLMLDFIKRNELSIYRSNTLRKDNDKKILTMTIRGDKIQAMDGK
jgi:hypothetical protein